MRGVLLVTLLILAPISMVNAENHENLLVEIQVESNITEKYSKSVQISFSRLSDLSQYEDTILSQTNDWVVVTGYPLEYHNNLISTSFESKDFELLKGTYIWKFEESSDAMSGLNKLIKNGEIEYFYPLIEKYQDARYIPNDPDFDEQWHLQNTGQTGGLSGEDINVTGVWNKYNGSGIYISVIDDGLDHEHPDIEDNYNSSFSYDWCNDDPDPSPNSWDAHGTAAGGVAAAVGDNGIDVTGSSFGASLSGSTLIACGTSDQMEADALGFQSNDIDIYTNSWEIGRAHV